MNRQFFHFALSCTSLFSLLCLEEAFSLVPYETYIESWDTNYQTALNNVPTPPGATQYQGMTVNIAFADYLFNNTGYYISGLQFSNFNPNSTTVGDIIAQVHSGGGKVKLSYGGANPSGTPNWPYFISNPGNTINIFASNGPDNLARVVQEWIQTGYNTSTGSTEYFDGVDFDIEDTIPTGQTAESMATAITNFLTRLQFYLSFPYPDRNQPPISVSITIPAQGWNTYWQMLAQNVATQKLVNCINFMEYDLWLPNPSSPTGYPDQIIADLQTYTGAINSLPGPNHSAGWGIPASMVQVGLMPQNDGSSNNYSLSVAQAQSVTQLILTPGAITPGQTFYQGVLTWDLDRDAQTSTTNPTTNPPNAAYAYTNAIRAETPSTQATNTQNRRNQSPRNGTGTTSSYVEPSEFIRQPVPPNGTP